MIERTYTKDELFHIHGLSESDKKIIERTIRHIIDKENDTGDKDTLEKQYLRGFLLQQTEGFEIDTLMRNVCVLNVSIFHEAWQTAAQEFDKLLKPLSDLNVVDGIYKTFKERFCQP